MALWVAVHGFQNNENVEEEILNRPIYELVERTNYLYARLQELAGLGTFESVRVTNVPLVSEGDNAPAVGDFVYLEESLGQYAKAQATPSAVDAFAAANSAYALGLLVSISEGTGTVVLYGKEALATSGAGWDLSEMLEEGELFTNGPYYLSPIEAGKITANPAGPAIYLGYIIEDPDNLGYGGYIMLSPQYKDMAEAHVHRAYPLYAQPAGTQVVSGMTPVDTHAVNGFETEAAAEGNDRIPRLVIVGNWAGLSDTQYTFWLSNSSDPNETLGSTSPPTDWDNCYLHWQSSDSAEGTGAEDVWTFESPVDIGTKGVRAILENAAGTDWDDPYYMDPGESGDSEDKRTWVLDVPTATQGWLARHLRQYFVDYPATDNGFSFIIMSGPHDAGDNRFWDELTVKCGEIHRLAYTGNAADGETVTIDTTVFEFDNDSSVTGSNIPVGIDTDPDVTFANLMDATLAAEISGVDVALDTTTGYLMILVPTATTVSDTVANATVAKVSDGAGDLVTGDVGLLVYDQYHKALVPTASFWNNVAYWTPTDLYNNLRIMAIPYDSDGTAASSDAVAVADYWTAQFNDEAPTAEFVYSVGMHQSLSQHYPPVPVTTAALVLNGIELDSYDLFPSDPTYRLGHTGIYWYSNLYDNVPWPVDWVDVDDPGSPEYVHNMLLHFVKMSLGEAGLVTSLRPAEGSPIRVLQCGTNEPATTGDLALDVDLALEEEEAGLAGYRVMKAVDGQKLRKGPVVEKIISPDGSINISQGVGHPTGQGTVALSVGNMSYGGEFEEVALNNAKQELIGMFPYVRLLGWSTGSAANTPTGFVAKFRVPHTIGAGSPSVPMFKVIVYMTVFGEENIAWAGGGSKLYAGIDFEYSVLPDFNPVNTDPAWNVLDNPISGSLSEGLITMSDPIHAEIPFGKYDAGGAHPIYTAYDPMLIHNNSAESPATDEDRKIAQILGNPFPVEADLEYWNAAWGEPVVKPGSLVGIRVTRADLVGGNPEYTGSIGFINIRWSLVSVV